MNYYDMCISAPKAAAPAQAAKPRDTAKSFMYMKSTLKQLWDLYSDEKKISQEAKIRKRIEELKREKELSNIVGKKADMIIMDDCFPTTSTPTYYTPYPHSLSSLNTLSTGCATSGYAPVAMTPAYYTNIGRMKASQETEDKNMANISIDTTNETATQRRYLTDRLWTVERKKLDDAAKAFKISEPEGPKTAKELQERLKNGQFTVLKADKDEDGEGRIYWGDWFSYISWRTPDNVADEAGYAAFKDKLIDAKQPVKDAIAIKTPQEALEVLNAFETKDLIAN